MNRGHKETKFIYFRYEVAQQMTQLCLSYGLPVISDPLYYAIEILPKGQEYDFLRQYVNITSDFLGVTRLSLIDHLIKKNLRDPYADHTRWDDACEQLRIEIQREEGQSR